MGHNQSKMDRALVSVKVSPALREYIVSINSGSDIISPSKGSRLWGLVKMHLETIPSDYMPVSPEGSCDSIRIALLKSKKKTYSFPSQRTVHLHTLYRDYLSDKGQRAVSKHLMKGFKQTFHAYMAGALNNNADLDIVEAIDEFLSDYHIEPEKVTVEMLRKDWYRYRQRFENLEQSAETFDL